MEKRDRRERGIKWRKERREYVEERQKGEGR